MASALISTQGYIGSQADYTPRIISDEFKPDVSQEGKDNTTTVTVDLLRTGRLSTVGSLLVANVNWTLPSLADAINIPCRFEHFNGGSVIFPMELLATGTDMFLAGNIEVSRIRLNPDAQHLEMVEVVSNGSHWVVTRSEYLKLP